MVSPNISVIKPTIASRRIDCFKCFTPRSYSSVKYRLLNRTTRKGSESSADYFHERFSYYRFLNLGTFHPVVNALQFIM